MKLIDKDVLVAEIERRATFFMEESKKKTTSDDSSCAVALYGLLSFLNTLEVKEGKDSAPISYVVSRSEEHADYVEEVFFDENKAQEYCDQFKGNENEYARYITKVEVTL